jgi:hypothetical protein
MAGAEKDTHGVDEVILGSPSAGSLSKRSNKPRATCNNGAEAVTGLDVEDEGADGLMSESSDVVYVTVASKQSSGTTNSKPQPCAGAK